MYVTQVAHKIRGVVSNHPDDADDVPVLGGFDSDGNII